jgi:hypothetical protein
MADESKQRSSSGRGWHGDPTGHAKAGRKGGEATARNHNSKFYEEIGKRGGKVSSGSFQKGSERAREAGRKGGRSTRQA